MASLQTTLTLADDRSYILCRFTGMPAPAAVTQVQKDLLALAEAIGATIARTTHLPLVVAVVVSSDLSAHRHENLH